MIPTLEVIAGFATGAVIGSLDVLAATTGEQLDGNDALTATIVAPKTVVLRQRSMLRFRGSDGRVREYRVRRIVRNSATQTWEIEAVPPWLDLSKAGQVRVLTGIMTTFTVSGTYTAAQWLTLFVLSNLSADGLTWLDTTLGTIQATGVRTLTFQNATRMEMLQAVAEAFGVEWQISQPTPGSLYRIALWTTRGGDAGTYAVDAVRNLLESNEDADDEQLATGVIATGLTPAGATDPATVMDNLWRVTNVASGWVSLTDPATGLGPIGIDDLVNGLYLYGPLTGGGAPQAYQILDSRSSDHAVQVATTGGIAVGALFSIRRTADGAGVFELGHPTAASTFGRSVDAYAIDSARGEANLIEDGRFANAIANWAAVNPQTPPAFVEIRRNELNVSLSGQIAAARPAGTGTGTALSLKSFPANTRFRQQDQLVVDGTTLSVNGDAIPSTAGVLVLPISPSLPGTYPDNTPVVLTRTVQRSVTTKGTIPVLSRFLQFNDSAETDGLSTDRPIWTATRAAESGTALTSTTVTYASLDTGVAYPVLAGDIFTYGDGVGQALNAAWGRQSVTAYTTDNFSHGASLTGAGGIVNGFQVNVAASSAILAALPGLTTVGHFIRPRGLNQRFKLTFASGRTRTILNMDWVFQCESVTLTSGVYTLNYRAWVPSGITEVAFEVFPFVPFYAEGSSVGVYYFEYTTSAGVFPANDAWTLSATREARTLYFSGTQTAGASSVTLKPDTSIARRNWQSGDTISVPLFQSDTMAYTAFTLTENTGIDEETGDPIITGYTYSFTLNTASSTLDDNIANYEVGALYTFPVGGAVTGAGSLTFLGYSGGVAQFGRAAFGSPTPPTFATSGTATVTRNWTYVFNVSGSATWGTNGRVTVPISNPLSVGVARGQVLNANWCPGSYGAALRLFTAYTASATSLDVLGGDVFDSGTGIYTGAGTVGLYRIEANRATMPLAGEIMTVAANATADSSGNASVTLVSANTNAVPLNAVVRLSRPNLLRPTDSMTGSVVRLLYALGGSSIPTNTSPGIRANLFRVDVPPGSTRMVTVYATIAMNTGTYALGQLPAIAIVSETGAVLGYTRFATATVNVGTLVHNTLIAQAVLTESQNVALAAFGGFTNSPQFWHALIEGWAVVSAATDVPYVNGSHANALWFAAVKYLQVYARAVTKFSVTVAQLQQITGLTIMPSAITVGQTVINERTGESVRLAAITIDHFDFTKTVLTLDTLRLTAARLLGVR